MTQEALPTVFELTPLNPAYNDDPNRLLDRLRTECPVLRDDTAGTFMLTRHADVRSVLSDISLWRDPIRAEPEAVLAKRLRDRQIDGVEVQEDADKGILLLDDPDHSRIRNPLAKALYKRTGRCRALVQAVIDTYLDELTGRTRFDVMADFARRIPIDVVARIIGVDETRLAEFRIWSEGIVHSVNPFRTPAQKDQLVDAANAMSAYMKELMEARRKEPADDFVSDMVTLQAEGAPLSDGELSVNLELLLVAGNITTTDLIGSGIWLLLSHPEELAKLRADPSLVSSAVEEILRCEGPIDTTGRVASRDLEIGGCPVKATQSMFLSLRGANHDPDVFADPHRFDISRKGSPHVAFGGGAHLCIGASLARLQGQIALSSFFARFPDVRLAAPDEKPRWRILPFFRGMEELMVVV